MKLWSRIRRMSIGQGFRLIWVLLQRPLLIWPTWKATQETMQECSRLYGNVHHRNGKPNAFRHALWNILICKKTLKFTKNDKKSANWAKIVTDLHEKIAKSEILDTLMDLHNNRIGRKLFLDDLGQNQSNLTDFLQKKLENSQKVANIQDFDKIKDEFVYILE